MEIEIEGGLNVKINQKNNTASIIKSPKAKGTVFIPRFVEFENHKYKIISIEQYAFSNIKIDSLTFPEDSEVESFEWYSFSYSGIKKLQIPLNLKYLKFGWASGINELTTIEVSPKNKNFSLYNNKLLLGKSQEN